MPGALTAAIVESAAWRVTRHRYAVDGWGVGELVVRDGVLVAHALPSRRAGSPSQRSGPHGGASTPEVTLAAKRSREGDGLVADLCRGSRDSPRRARRSRTTTCRVDSTWGSDAFQRSSLVRRGRVAWGEVVTYGELAALAGRPRAARAAGSFCAAQPPLARRPVPPRRRGVASRTGSGRTERRASG